MRKRATAFLVAIGGVVLAGCVGEGDGDGTANGVADLGPDEILSEAQAAAEAASSVHMTGSFEFTEDGGKLEFDITADQSGGTGVVTLMGTEFEVLSVEGTEYMRAGADFWGTVMGDPAEVERAADKYVKGSAGGAAGIDMSRFLDFDFIVDERLVPDGEITKGEQIVVGEQSVIGLEVEDGTTMYVATTGEPLPVRLAPPDGEFGSFDFEWGVDADIVAPDEADVIDLSEIE